MNLTLELQTPATESKRLPDATAPVTKTLAVVIDIPPPISPTVPEGFLSAVDFVRQFDADEVSEGRKWVKENLYADDGQTVRTMRMERGWSQEQLAQSIGTVQPHVSRMESGRDNLMIDTCRKLCNAFDIDMNTLDAALRRQEELNQAKSS